MFFILLFDRSFQTIIDELNQSYYIIDTEIRNKGVQYADSFYVASRYCLIQLKGQKTKLKVTCEVKYVKDVMSFAKSKLIRISSVSLELLRRIFF